MGHQCSRVYDVSTLQIADHICVWDKSLLPLRYQHHGIVRQTGTCVETIQVAHIWSPIENNRKAAQDDSRWRVTSLAEFLFNRPISALRVVQYYTSFLGDLQMKWGEAHMSPCDIPTIVLARVDWLMGQGVGKFNILFQNCEHAAYWCKTGKQWCKQALTPRRNVVPFPVPAVDKESLFKEIRHLQEHYLRQQYSECPEYRRTIVQLTIGGDRFVHIKSNKQAFAHSAAELKAQNIEPTRFYIEQKRVAYNVVHFSFRCVQTDRYLYAPPLWYVGRGLSVRYRHRGRGLGARNGHRFVRHGNGEMQSLHHDRNWLSLDSDHRLVLCANRSEALAIGFVQESTTTENTVVAKEPEVQEQEEQEADSLVSSSSSRSILVVLPAPKTPLSQRTFFFRRERTKSCVSTEFETSSNEGGIVNY